LVVKMQPKEKEKEKCYIDEDGKVVCE